MKMALRVIAGCLALVLALPAVVVVSTLPAALRSGASVRTRLLMLALSSVIAMGVYAAVQLWRLRNSGRYATLGLATTYALLWLASLLRGHTLNPTALIELALLSCVGVTLLSPAAARACKA